MAYNITALPVFQTEGKAFVIKSILEAQTISMLTNFDATAKGIQSVQLLDSDITITDGSACGRNPSGGAVLSQALLTVKPLKINQDYCERVLEKTWAKGELSAGQNYDSMAFLKEISEINSAKASLEIEKMIWLGDTTLTGSTSLKQIDGFIKQIKAGSYINLSGATGATTVAKLQAIDAAMPIEVSQADDFYILMGQDTYKKYVAEMAALNLYASASDGVLWGTTSKIKSVNGLNGGHVVATRLRNLVAGGEMTDVDFKSYFDYPTETLMLDTRFSLGVVPVYTQEIGYVKY
ncbi:hypothetical protein [Pedobacter aquatilis]|uniref:hypothetical protein n=1 Tax=Pedobacter aquatilis TaxID=351343 RepID=UPI002930586B|nr:hypothetical protein [Pedobacter aquatilis]